MKSRLSASVFEHSPFGGSCCQMLSQTYRIDEHFPSPSFQSSSVLLLVVVVVERREKERGTRELGKSCLGEQSRVGKKRNAGDDAKEWSEKMETISERHEQPSLEQMAFFPEWGRKKKKEMRKERKKNKRGENLFERAKGSFLPSLIARSDSEIEQTDRVAYTVQSSKYIRQRVQ